MSMAQYKIEEDGQVVFFDETVKYQDQNPVFMVYDPHVRGHYDYRKIEFHTTSSEFTEHDKIGIGDMGIVRRAVHSSGAIVAMKKLENETNETVMDSKEIQFLAKLRDVDNVIRILAVVQEEEPYVIFEYAHIELSAFIHSPVHYMPVHVKRIGYQLLTGLAAIHKMNIVHRDIKPSHLLISALGVLKITGFEKASLIRVNGKPTNSETHGRLQYRAPELLFGYTVNSEKLDIWSAGCVIAEVAYHGVLFDGENVNDQILLIEDGLGPITSPYFTRTAKWAELKNPETVRRTKNSSDIVFPDNSETKEFPFIDSIGVGVLKKLLQINPNLRRTAEQILLSPWFKKGPGSDLRNLLKHFMGYMFSYDKIMKKRGNYQYGFIPSRGPCRFRELQGTTPEDFKYEETELENFGENMALVPPPPKKVIPRIIKIEVEDEMESYQNGGSQKDVPSSSFKVPKQEPVSWAMPEHDSQILKTIQEIKQEIDEDISAHRYVPAMRNVTYTSSGMRQYFVPVIEPKTEPHLDQDAQFGQNVPVRKEEQAKKYVPYKHPVHSQKNVPSTSVAIPKPGPPQKTVPAAKQDPKRAKNEQQRKAVQSRTLPTPKPVTPFDREEKLKFDEEFKRAMQSAHLFKKEPEERDEPKNVANEKGGMPTQDVSSKKDVVSKHPSLMRQDAKAQNNEEPRKEESLKPEAYLRDEEQLKRDVQAKLDAKAKKGVPSTSVSKKLQSIEDTISRHLATRNLISQAKNDGQSEQDAQKKNDDPSKKDVPSASETKLNQEPKPPIQDMLSKQQAVPRGPVTPPLEDEQPKEDVQSASSTNLDSQAVLSEPKPQAKIDEQELMDTTTDGVKHLKLGSQVPKNEAKQNISSEKKPIATQYASSKELVSPALSKIDQQPKHVQDDAPILEKETQPSKEEESQKDGKQEKETILPPPSTPPPSLPASTAEESKKNEQSKEDISTTIRPLPAEFSRLSLLNKSPEKAEQSKQEAPPLPPLKLPSTIAEESKKDENVKKDIITTVRPLPAEFLQQAFSPSVQKVEQEKHNVEAKKEHGIPATTAEESKKDEKKEIRPLPAEVSRQTLLPSEEQRKKEEQSHKDVRTTVRPLPTEFLQQPLLPSAQKHDVPAENNLGQKTNLLPTPPPPPMLPVTKESQPNGEEPTKKEEQLQKGIQTTVRPLPAEFLQQARVPSSTVLPPPPLPPKLPVTRVEESKRDEKGITTTVRPLPAEFLQQPPVPSTQKSEEKPKNDPQAVKDQGLKTNHLPPPPPPPMLPVTTTEDSKKDEQVKKDISTTVRPLPAEFLQRVPSKEEPKENAHSKHDEQQKKDLERQTNLLPPPPPPMLPVTTGKESKKEDNFKKDIITTVRPLPAEFLHQAPSSSVQNSTEQAKHDTANLLPPPPPPPILPVTIESNGEEQNKNEAQSHEGIQTTVRPLPAEFSQQAPLPSTQKSEEQPKNDAPAVKELGQNWNVLPPPPLPPKLPSTIAEEKKDEKAKKDIPTTIRPLPAEFLQQTHLPSTRKSEEQPKNDAPAVKDLGQNWNVLPPPPLPPKLPPTIAEESKKDEKAKKDILTTVRPLPAEFLQQNLLPNAQKQDNFGPKTNVLPPPPKPPILPVTSVDESKKDEKVKKDVTTTAQKPILPPPPTPPILPAQTDAQSKKDEQSKKDIPTTSRPQPPGFFPPKKEDGATKDIQWSKDKQVTETIYTSDAKSINSCIRPIPDEFFRSISPEVPAKQEDQAKKDEESNETVVDTPLGKVTTTVRPFPPGLLSSIPTPSAANTVEQPKPDADTKQNAEEKKSGDPVPTTSKRFQTMHFVPQKPPVQSTKNLMKGVPRPPKEESQTKKVAEKRTLSPLPPPTQPIPSLMSLVLSEPKPVRERILPPSPPPVPPPKPSKSSQERASTSSSRSDAHRDGHSRKHEDSSKERKSRHESRHDKHRRHDSHSSKRDRSRHDSRRDGGSDHKRRRLH